MAGFVDILAAIPWQNPWAQTVVQQVVRAAMGGTTEDPDVARERRMEALIDRYEETLRSLSAQTPAQAIPAAPVAAAPPAVGVQPVMQASVAAAPPDVLRDIRERVTRVSGNCKEALRFAREDGMDHPEVRTRLARAQGELDELERHDLRPEVLVMLAPDQRRAVDLLLPELRRARQGLHNTADGGPPTVDSLTDAAARLGALGTRVRVLEATTAAGVALPEAMAGPAADANADSQTVSEPAPYSRYAPDMRVDTGCLPCGRAHVAGTDAILRSAADEAAQRGMADPDVQARIQSAAEELAMVYEHDWTPARIAASPPDDRAILERFAPRFRAVEARLAQARTPEELRDVADEMSRAREEFMAADQARATAGPAEAPAQPRTPQPEPEPEAQAAFASFRPGASAAGVPGDHRLDLAPWTAVQPGYVTLGTTTMPRDSERAFDALATAIHRARGVRVVFRETPRPDGGIVEAEYDPEANTITMGPFALAKDFYAVQTLAHEVAHALTVNRDCMPVLPEDHADEERVAEDTALAAMLEAGLPVELRSGAILEPGERTVDWAMMQDALAPDLYAQVRFATDWITAAIEGADPDTLPRGCAVAIPV